MKHIQFTTEKLARTFNRRLDRVRRGVYTSNIGGRYMFGVSRLKSIGRFCAQKFFWDEAVALLGIPVEALAFLSMSALDVEPGDPGIGKHVDYPHHVFPTAPHLCAQFILSLDGTDAERAPLWIEEPSHLVCMEPGELLIFGGNVLHGVHPNKSNRRRTTLLWSIGPNWIRPMLPEVWNWTAGRGP